MISTEKQWSVYIWNRCTVMEDHISDSSPEISKVNWILNFSQERHIVQMALTGRNLSLYPHSSSISFLFIQIFFYIHRWDKKSCRVSLCRLFDIRCAFFYARVRRNYWNIGDIVSVITRSILVTYLHRFVTSCYKLCQNNRVFLHTEKYYSIC